MDTMGWLRVSRARRGLAASAIVLALGGLVLWRTPAKARVIGHAEPRGENVAAFSGPGLQGTLSLSHSKVLASGARRVFAELVLRAAPAEGSQERAPLSLAIVLDTSGSMQGRKIVRAKQAVAQLLGQMRDDDQIALVRYASAHEMMQPLARLGSVRQELLARIETMNAGGGTSIPPALASGLRAVRFAGGERVRRVVLISDGLDGSGSPHQAAQLARGASDSATTVSALGIGLDFDEAYMSGVAQAGRGNFGFIENASALASFLQRELRETAATTVQQASLDLELGEHLRFVRAVGAQANELGEPGEVDLTLGSLFAGDERRIVLELQARAEAGEALNVHAQVSWSQVAGDAAEVRLSQLSITGTADAAEAREARDGRVVASCLSVLAAARQLEAMKAFGRGDAARGNGLIQQNVIELSQAAADAPAPAAEALERQVTAYRTTQAELSAAPVASPRARAARKASAAGDTANLHRAWGY